MKPSPPVLFPEYVVADLRQRLAEAQEREHKLRRRIEGELEALATRCEADASTARRRAASPALAPEIAGRHAGKANGLTAGAHKARALIFRVRKW